MFRRLILAVCWLAPVLSVPAVAENGSASNRPVAAKKLFGAARVSADLKARSYGGYARGCVAGAERLPADGTTWQAMRLKRNRNWGHPALIAYVRKLASGVPKDVGWKGLLIGDMSQPRGGPMLTGHASHQIGLDADIWLKPMPGRRLSGTERQKISAVSMIKDRRTINKAVWTPQHARLLKRAASDRRVARIFIHPAIKQALCKSAGKDRGWLRRIRPWYGHHYHFHVRLKCPPGNRGCRNQAGPPPGDGCGKELAWWLSDKPYKKIPGKKARKRRPLVLRDLPGSCRRVLAAKDKAQADVAAIVVTPPAKAVSKKPDDAKPGGEKSSATVRATLAPAPAKSPEPKSEPAKASSNDTTAFFAAESKPPIPPRKPPAVKISDNGSMTPAPIPGRKPPPPRSARSGPAEKDGDIF